MPYYNNKRNITKNQLLFLNTKTTLFLYQCLKELFQNIPNFMSNLNAVLTKTLTLFLIPLTLSRCLGVQSCDFYSKPPNTNANFIQKINKINPNSLNTKKIKHASPQK